MHEGAGMTLQIKLAAALAFVCALIGSHWCAYASGGRNHTAALRLEYAAATQSAEKAARAKEQEYALQLKKAHDDAIRRQSQLQADASAARAESSRLHDSLADFRRQLPDLTNEAVRRYADTASIVFGECAQRYAAVAEDAERLSNAVQTLNAAWPE